MFKLNEKILKINRRQLSFLFRMLRSKTSIKENVTLQSIKISNITITSF
jgi:hypothetical protein